MRSLRPDAYFERAETGIASTADSNATNNTEGELPLPRHETVWGSIAGPYAYIPEWSTISGSDVSRLPCAIDRDTSRQAGRRSNVTIPAARLGAAVRPASVHATL
jgi:hypothetical protein